MPENGEIEGCGCFRRAPSCPEPSGEAARPSLCDSCGGEGHRVPPPGPSRGSGLCVGMSPYNFSCVLCGVWAREFIPQRELHLRAVQLGWLLALAGSWLPESRAVTTGSVERASPRGSELPALPKSFPWRFPAFPHRRHTKHTMPFWSPAGQQLCGLNAHAKATQKRFLCASKSGAVETLMSPRLGRS